MDRHGLTDADLCELANDQEFQRIIETDAVLDKYDEETYDEKKEFFSLIWFLGLAPVAVGRLPLRPLTPAKWAFLWGIGNAYAREKKDAKPVDADVFLFILASDLRDLGCTVPEIPGKASGTAAAAGLSFQQAHQEIEYLIAVAFLPLQLLPRKKPQEDPHYDTEWLADVVSVVSKESGENASFILHDMPMNSVCAYVVSAKKSVDIKHEVGRRAPEQINEDIMDRAYALGAEYLAQKRNPKNN